MQPFMHMCKQVEIGKRNKYHGHKFHGTPEQGLCIGIGVNWEVYIHKELLFRVFLIKPSIVCNPKKIGTVIMATLFPTTLF